MSWRDPHSGETPKGRSLSWKLAFSQTWQLIGSYIKTNFLVCLLFLLSLIVWSEMKVATVYTQTLITLPETVETIALEGEQITAEKSAIGQGVQLKFFLEDRGLTKEGSFRQIGLGSASNLLFGHLRTPYYRVYMPTEDGDFWAVTVPWDTPISFFVVAFSMLLLLQLLGIPFRMIKARNRIRRALQPIYELTATALDISSTGVSEPMVPLSGTIDALNTITGTHFDRRIPVSGERQELQGLAKAINDMLDRLSASYQAQLRFVSDASHELRTPISIIQGYARLLTRWGKDDPKTLQESVDAIQTEAEGMQILVEQLLFLARSDNQSLTPKNEEVDLSDLMTEVIRETEMISESHQIVEHIPPGIWLVADPQLLKQATRILVDNSIKYTPDGGRITIGLEETPDEVQIYVSDNGVGVPAGELEHLFDRFWRADESRTRKTGGTGLGLSIARWIAEIHGGNIQVTSREQIGSRFTICVPTKDRKVLRPIAPKHDPPGGRLPPREDFAEPLVLQVPSDDLANYSERVVDPPVLVLPEELDIDHRNLGDVRSSAEYRNPFDTPFSTTKPIDPTPDEVEKEREKGGVENQRNL